MEKYNMITEKKFNTSVDELCDGLPSKFKCLLTICLQLNLHYFTVIVEDQSLIKILIMDI